MMQEMQAFLAERQIEAHVTTTVFKSSADGTVHHACEITVFGDEGIVAKSSWGSYRTKDFEPDWAEFEKKVKDEFFGWWE